MSPQSISVQNGADLGSPESKMLVRVASWPTIVALLNR